MVKSRAIAVKNTDSERLSSHPLNHISMETAMESDILKAAYSHAERQKETQI